MATTIETPWWLKTTIYQIYPRSFMDSNRDGIGDLQGIISRLDYIRDLGFETIWLSPFFGSPQQDWGYDVSDYTGVAPEYGNLADAEELVEQVHQRGMRVLFDLVMNHTSIQHPWFQESRSSRDHPRRDWYIWRDGRGTRPPNNWKAITGGSGWHHDATTDQWYYASFMPFQPDLNYRHPEVKAAMFDVARYWLDRGVDGFRLDIFHCIYKDEQFRDNPFSPTFVPLDDTSGFFQRWEYTLNLPETIELARELRSLADSYAPDRLLLGELFGDDETILKYLGAEQDGLGLIFLWDLLKLKADAGFLKDVVRRYEAGYPAPYAPVYVLGNHDRKRIISRVGHDARKAKLLALLQFTARGVPVTYYGEEIGMAEVHIPARDSKDPVGQRYKWIPDWLVDLLGLYVNRDGCRAPMQWDGGPNAGFCAAGATPWLPVHENHRAVNVAQQLGDEDSILGTCRRLLHLRRASAALQAGDLQLMDDADTGRDLLAYLRQHGEEAVLVVMNWGQSPRTFHNPTGCRRVLFETGAGGITGGTEIELPPLCGLILAE